MVKTKDKPVVSVDRSGHPRCRDFDEDCDLVVDKVNCYLYDPAKGYCPYLRALHTQK